MNESDVPVNHNDIISDVPVGMRQYSIGGGDVGPFLMVVRWTNKKCAYGDHSVAPMILEVRGTDNTNVCPFWLNISRTCRLCHWQVSVTQRWHAERSSETDRDNALHPRWFPTLENNASSHCNNKTLLTTRHTFQKHHPTRNNKNTQFDHRYLIELWFEIE
jgi:hypothetical protein